MSASSQTAYYVSHESKYLGPFNLEEIRKMLSNQDLNLNDKAFLEGPQDWVPIHTLPGLKGFVKKDEAANALAPKQEKSSSSANDNPSKGLQMKAPEVKFRNQNQNQNQNLSLSQQTQIEPMVPVSESENEMNLAPLPNIKSSQTEPKALAQPLPEKPKNAPPTGPVGLILISEDAKEADDERPAEITDPHIDYPLPSASEKNDEVVQMPRAATSFSIGEQKIELKNGKAELTLADLKISGDFIIELENGELTEKTAHAAIAVQPNQVSELEIAVADKVSVGDQAILQVLAKDQFGNIATQCDASFELKSTGQAQFTGNMKLQRGIAQVQIRSTLVETIEISLQNIDHEKPVNCSPKKVQFVAGPAVRLVVVTPQSAVAGEKVNVEVKALDQFGNLSEGFSSSVNMKILKKSG